MKSQKIEQEIVKLDEEIGTVFLYIPECLQPIQKLVEIDFREFLKRMVPSAKCYIYPEESNIIQLTIEPNGKTMNVPIWFLMAVNCWVRGSEKRWSVIAGKFRPHRKLDMHYLRGIYLDTNMAAEIMGSGYSTILHWVDIEDLKATWIGNRVLIELEDLVQFKKEKEKEKV